MGVSKKLDTLTKLEKNLEIKKSRLIEDGLKSKSPNDVLKAQKNLRSIQEREKANKKSYLLDPIEFNSSFGYKDKPYSLSYNSLRSMSKVPVINAIIKTRKNQIADFAEPQSDKYSTGFVIRKKMKPGETSQENTAEDWKNIEFIQDFILNCGVNESWESDDFDTFVRKVIQDSLTYDQMTFEVIRDKKGYPFEFVATDAATFRVADSYDDDEYVQRDEVKKQVKGYFPSYVQVYQNNVVEEFYPWELCFGVRNPSTSIHNVGYGISELEELTSTITSMLWADEYNKKFFSQGAAPKGMLRVKGDVNNKQLEAFRQEWLSTLTGVNNSWKTPVVDGDEVEWIDMHKSNKDMEYSAWSEYLIKLACSIYSIDPSEIGFDISSPGANSVFESSNESKLKHSKDKGLYPLLKFLQRKLNKYIVNQLDDRYELLFVGLNGQTIEQEIEQEIKKASSFQTLGETREKFGLESLGEENDSAILNPTFIQHKSMQQMQQQQEQAQEDEEDDDEFDLDDMDEEENPFLKSFKNNLKK